MRISLNTACCIAVLAGSATSAAHAQNQSTIQLYGVADAGITHVTGLAGGSVNQVASGIMEGSRWGIKGQEDMGGGYRALFTLESRVEMDTGANSNRPISGTQLPQRLSTTSGLGLPSALAPVVAGLSAQFGNTVGVNLANNAFDRQAFVGLVTPVGAIIAGRQYTPGYETFGTFETMKTESALSAGQLVSTPSGIDIRISNALQYRIQLSGLTASVMYGFGEAAGNASRNRLWGGMVNYKADAYSVGVGYNTRNNELGQKSLTNTVIGGTVNIGPGSLNVMTGTIKDDNPTGLSTIATTLQGAPFGLPAATAQLVQSSYVNAFKQDARLFNVGYRYTRGNNTYSIAYSKLDDKRASNADVSSYGFAVTHAMSKRTDLNFVVAKADNSSNSQVALGGAGYLGGVTRAPGVDSTSIAVGLRHRF